MRRASSLLRHTALQRPLQLRSSLPFSAPLSLSLSHSFTTCSSVATPARPSAFFSPFGAPRRHMATEAAAAEESAPKDGAAAPGADAKAKPKQKKLTKKELEKLKNARTGLTPYEDFWMGKRDQDSITRFLAKLGLESYAEKFRSMNNLLNATTGRLKGLGMTVKQRKMVRRLIERYKLSRRITQANEYIQMYGVDLAPAVLQQRVYAILHGHLYEELDRTDVNKELETAWRARIEKYRAERKMYHSDLNGLREPDLMSIAKIEAAMMRDLVLMPRQGFELWDPDALDKIGKAIVERAKKKEVRRLVRFGAAIEGHKNLRKLTRQQRKEMQEDAEAVVSEEIRWTPTEDLEKMSSEEFAEIDKDTTEEFQAYMVEQEKQQPPSSTCDDEEKVEKIVQDLAEETWGMYTEMYEEVTGRKMEEDKLEQDLIKGGPTFVLRQGEVPDEKEPEGSDKK